MSNANYQGVLIVIVPQERILIKYHLNEGEPIVRVAARYRVSRQTIYNHLKRTGIFPKPRAPRVSKLQPYLEYIQARLERFDLPATVVLAEIIKKGYRGGITILREQVRRIKGREIQRITERFETLPAQQAQLDWGECGSIEVDGRRRKLYLFVFVLGYSRMLFARFTISTKLPVLLRCLQEAFERLGITKELLIDNMKQAVELNDGQGQVRFNRQFLSFLEHYECVPVAAPPYWPRIKGKVERGVGYLKSSFLEGRCFSDLADLNGQLEGWVETVGNLRVHGTTGEPPVVRYQQEHLELRPFAAMPIYDTRPLEFRRVSTESHISYDGVLYSVDPHHAEAGRMVEVRAEGERIGERFEVYCGTHRVAEHRIAPKAAIRITTPEHEEAIKRLNRHRGRTGRASRAPQFDQVPDEPLGTQIPVADEEVLSPSLELYEQILQGDTE